MSDILIEICNDNFKSVKVLKASTQEQIFMLAPTEHKTVKLLNRSNTVTICANTKGSATIKLEGVEDSTPFCPQGRDTDDLEDDKPLSLKPTTNTRLTLRWENPKANAVKCGEVIIEPPLAS